MARNSEEVQDNSIGRVEHVSLRVRGPVYVAIRVEERPDGTITFQGPTLPGRDSHMTARREDAETVKDAIARTLRAVFQADCGC